MIHTTAHYINFLNVERTRTFFLLLFLYHPSLSL
jgi:hypothetical protein